MTLILAQSIIPVKSTREASPMINGFKVIDADAHMQEPLDVWDKYVEPEFYDRRPIIKSHRYRLMFDYEDSELYPAQPEGKDQMGRLRPTEILERQPIKYGEAYEEWWSPESRLRDMEKYGWDRMVCIPGTGAQPLKLEGKDPALMWALTRAYHNWSHDFCQADPSKLKMVAQIPPYDMENTLIEMRRAVEELGAVTVMMTASMSFMPCSSVTVSRNRSLAALDGAVKVARTVSAPLRVTFGPLVCFHA